MKHWTDLEWDEKVEQAHLHGESCGCVLCDHVAMWACPECGGSGRIREELTPESRTNECICTDFRNVDCPVHAWPGPRCETCKGVGRCPSTTS